MAALSEKPSEAAIRCELLASALGSLDRVDLGLFFIRGCLNVSRQVAVSVFPLHGRIRKRRAEPTGFMLFAPVAAAACLDDLDTGAAVIYAALRGHKRAFFAFSRGFTYHHVLVPPYQYNEITRSNEIIWF